MSSRDPDRFDVTRKSGGDSGAPFAPSWAILAPTLAKMRRARRYGDEGGMRSAWEHYRGLFLGEMRVSYVHHREAWETLLARPRVVLVCYCTDSERCHRTLLAGMGADVRGEVT